MTVRQKSYEGTGWTGLDVSMGESSFHFRAHSDRASISTEISDSDAEELAKWILSTVKKKKAAKTTLPDPPVRGVIVRDV